MTAAPAPAANETDGARTLPLPSAPLRLEATNPNGTIDIVGADRSDLRVSWTKRGDPASPAWGAAAIRIDEADGTVRVAAEPAGPGFPFAADSPTAIIDAAVDALKTLFASNASGWPGAVRYDLRIEVPAFLAGGEVAASTASGTVHLDGFAADRISATAASGGVSVAAVSGELSVTTASGPLSVAGARGSCDARSASGPITVDASQSLDLRAKTAGGSITLRLGQGTTGSAKLASASGRVDLSTVPGTVAAVAIRTASGRVTGRAPWQADGAHRWRAGFGSGWTIAVQTASGPIRLAGAMPDEAAAAPPSTATAVEAAIGADPATPPPPAAPTSGPAGAARATSAAAPPVGELGSEPSAGPPSPDPAPTDRPAVRDLLRAVEQGELDIEEALRRLEATETAASVTPQPPS